MSSSEDEDRLTAAEQNALNEQGDPYPLDVIRPGVCRRALETVKRAFDTKVYSQKTMESEVAALQPYKYGGLAVRYLTWRASVMMMGVVFLVYTVSDDIVRTVQNIAMKNHHHSGDDLYRKIFGVQVLIGTISDSIYALSLLVSLVFSLYAVYQWKNYRLSARLLRIGYVISFCTPFVLMLTFEYRAGINVPELAADACHSVINGRVPDIMAQIKGTGSGGSAHNAKKRAKKAAKPSVATKFKHLVADHVPQVNLTNIFHTLNVQMPSNICDFHKSSWSADVKQHLINAGFVRDQKTNMCGASIKALKVMHVLPKNYVAATPKFRHLLEETSSASEEVFSFDSEKHFTKEQCKPCESCVDPDCRKQSMKLLGKHFSMVPAFHKALHAVRTAKATMKAFEKNHVAQIKKAEEELKHLAHHAADKFTKELEKSNPKFKKIIEAGKKAMKELDVKGALALHKYIKTVKTEYKKLKKEEHDMLINLQKEGKKHVSRARKHGKHAHKRAEKKFEKKFKKATKEAHKKLKKAKKKMLHKIRMAKAKFASKKAVLLAKVAAARHARLKHSKGGNKMLLKFKSHLFHSLQKVKASLERKFKARSKTIKAELHKLKSKYKARLAKPHHSKRYVEHLKNMYKKVAKSQAKVLAKLKKAEAKLAARIKHAKAQFRLFSGKHDIATLLVHIKKHAKADAKRVEHLLYHVVKSTRHIGLFRIRSMVKAAKTQFHKFMAKHKADYVAAKKAARHAFFTVKMVQKHKLSSFEKEVAKALSEAKKKGKAEYAAVKKETTKQLAQFHKDHHIIMEAERTKMHDTVDKHYAIFKKYLKEAKAKLHNVKAKAHKKSSILKFLSTHAAHYKNKFMKNRLKYKEAYLKIKHHQRAQLTKMISEIKTKMGSSDLLHHPHLLAKMQKDLSNAAHKAKEEIRKAKITMKTKTLKAKFVYKAHKAEMKKALDHARHEAAKMVAQLHKHHTPTEVKVAARKLLAAEPEEVQEAVPGDHDDFADVSEADAEFAFSQVEEFESDEDELDRGHQKIPQKCHSCHAACFKNCAAQYFGPALLKQTVNSYMCMGTTELNSIDTIKSAMDNVNHIDIVLGGKDGMMAFVLLLPAALSFLSAVLKASKLVKQLLPQSRLAGYLVVFAAISNIPIMAAIISVIYQSVGDIYFCIGVLSFLTTFMCFIFKPESLVKNQSHTSASQQIDRRGKFTFVGFALAGIFLGIFASEHVAFLRMALNLPLKMLIIKKVCDFLGRTMFTLVVIVDLLLYVFDKLYGQQGDAVEGQAFEIPLTQIKRLFVDRKKLFEDEEA